MPTFLSEEAHEQYCDREGLPEDCAPEAIDEEPTVRLEPVTTSALIRGFCMVCGARSEGTCPSCEAERLEGRR